MSIFQETLPDQVGPGNSSYLDIFIVNEVSGVPTNMDSPAFEVFGTGGDLGYASSIDPGYPALVGLSGSYYCRLTLSTGNGFEQNKTYSVRITDSSPNPNIFLKNFKLTQSIPQQIFGSLPEDYAGEENFAQFMVDINNNVDNMPSGIWDYNLYGPESYGVTDAAYLVRDLREFVLYTYALATEMDLRIDTGRADQLDSIPTILSRQVTIQSSISGVSDKIGEPESTLAEDLSNTPAEVWLSQLGDYSPSGGTVAAAIDALPNSTDFITVSQSGAQAAIVANHLDHLLANVYEPGLKPGASDSLLNSIFENDDDVPRFTANALEQTWLTQASSVATSGSFGKIIKDVSTTLNTVSGNLTAASGTINTINNNIGTSGVNLANIPWNSTVWDAELATALDDVVKTNSTFTITTVNGELEVTFGAS